MGRQIRAPITMSFTTKEYMQYRKYEESNTEKTEILLQKKSQSVRAVYYAYTYTNIG